MIENKFLELLNFLYFFPVCTNWYNIQDNFTWERWIIEKITSKNKLFKTSLWTTIDTISGYIYVKTIFHQEKLFHFSRFFICFSCTTIDKISVIRLYENDLSFKIVFGFFQVLLYLSCVHPLKRSFEIHYVKTFFIEFFFIFYFFNIFFCYPKYMIFRTFLWENHFLNSTMFFNFQV